MPWRCSVVAGRTTDRGCSVALVSSGPLLHLGQSDLTQSKLQVIGYAGQEG